ncbi:hypothetical protein BFN03_07180 [Rhodococcus sp. WMMA185]|uniref:hypothetical protein n=1 Tax=Rhodococcus sp. WMMA185 TaxID=679318 RepID=UPI00087808BB|nr:hypothetical protein [Rhodococcus sp. WMMA185]AOW92562.1 hypothetical protein BFN03_07180 [Rhodococcus sp. WMMA185]
MNELIYVPDPEYFQGDEWTPERLYDLAQSMSPATIEQVQSTWRSLGEDASTTIGAFVDGIRREIATSWQGQAASNADSNASDYARSADPTRSQLQGVANALDPIYQAATQLKSGAVPEVQGLNWYDNLTPWLSNADQEYYRRHGEALDAMNNIYRPGVQDTDREVPVFDQLEDVVKPPDSTVPRTGSSPDGHGGGPGRPGTAPVSSPEYGQGDDEPGWGQTGPPPGSGDSPASTTAASATGSPVPSGMPTSGDASRLGSNPGIGGGGGGVGGGVAAAGGGFAGRAPGAMPGAGGAAGVRAGGLSGAGVRGPGMMGGGMMGAPGARSGGDGDKEHKTPGYLVTLDNGNELIGKFPAVAPPVIGA